MATTQVRSKAQFTAKNLVMASLKSGVTLGIKIAERINEDTGKIKKVFAKFRVPNSRAITLEDAVEALAKLEKDTPINVSIPKDEVGDLFIQLAPVMSAQRLHVAMVARSEDTLDFSKALSLEEVDAHLTALGLKEVE